MTNGLSTKTLVFVFQPLTLKIQNQMFPEMMANGKDANHYQLIMVKSLV